jgi:hypothetical protein
MAKHFKEKMNSYPQTNQPPEHQSPPPTHQNVDPTSTPPTFADIMATIKTMGSTAAGIDGIPSAMFKPHLPPPNNVDRHTTQVANTQQATAAGATAMISTRLEQLFRHVSRLGIVPSQWQQALLVPIYKDKGDANDLSNYRPLSMPTTSCRLWSSIINGKLMKATADILPDTMFGFRPDRSCIDPILTIRHLADMHRAKQGCIFGVAFMDLSGAYDSVNRERMFDKLHRIGVADHTLKLLKCLYSNNQCIIKCQGGTAQPFGVKCGLRQGCPLSTTLFNLYIYDLHTYINTHCPDHGVKMKLGKTSLNQQRLTEYLLISDLGYADDIALFADDPKHLQNMLNAFQQYCTIHDLIINPTKCEVVVFGGGKAWPHYSWQVNGNALTRAKHFKYLGVTLAGSRDIKACVEHRLQSMTRAQACVRRRLQQLHVQCGPSLIADLFFAIMRAAGDYGCEVWGTWVYTLALRMEHTRLHVAKVPCCHAEALPRR